MSRSERLNIPLNGLIKVPGDLTAAAIPHRAKYWKLLGRAALYQKRQEILAGLDIWGRKFVPVKRTWGVHVPLIPHSETSRTYELLSLNYSARGATLYWKSGGGRVPWPKILGYHAYKHGPRSLPVRNTIGISPRGVETIMAESEMWEAGYEAGYEAGLAAARSGAKQSKPSGRTETRLERLLREQREQAEQKKKGNR